MAEFKIRSREELAKLDTRGALPTANVQSVHNELTQRIDQMGFSKETLGKVTPVVREMTVADLRDFERKMAGVPQRNPVVQKLTIEDIQGVEYLFGSVKEAALSRIAVSTDNLGDLAADVDVSCCCCTPCCCCAAADTDPFAAEAAAM